MARDVSSHGEKGETSVNVIDQVLWEQELAEYLRTGADQPEQLDDPQHAEPALALPAALSGTPPAVMVLLSSLALLALCILGWGVGWYVI